MPLVPVPSGGSGRTRAWSRTGTRPAAVRPRPHPRAPARNCRRSVVRCPHGTGPAARPPPRPARAPPCTTRSSAALPPLTARALDDPEVAAAVRTLLDRGWRPAQVGPGWGPCRPADDPVAAVLALLGQLAQAESPQQAWERAAGRARPAAGARTTATGWPPTRSVPGGWPRRAGPREVPRRPGAAGGRAAVRRCASCTARALSSSPATVRLCCGLRGSARQRARPAGRRGLGDPPGCRSADFSLSTACARACGQVVQRTPARRSPAVPSTAPASTAARRRVPTLCTGSVHSGGRRAARDTPGAAADRSR